MSGVIKYQLEVGEDISDVGAFSYLNCTEQEITLNNGETNIALNFGGVTNADAFYIKSDQNISVYFASSGTEIPVVANKPLILSGTNLTAVYITNQSGSSANILWKIFGDSGASTTPAVSDLSTALANTSNIALGDAMVGYKGSSPSGVYTGAIARTVHDRLADMEVSVRDFGAVGDGVTDDTAALTAAFAATDGWVKLQPDCTYIVTLSVDPQDGTKYRVFPIKSNMLIDGQGATIKLKDNESTTENPKHFNIFRYVFTSAVSNIHFKDLTIDINGLNNKIDQLEPIPEHNPIRNCAAFYIEAAGTEDANILFENCRFLNTPGANFIIAVTGGVTVKDCVFREGGSDIWDHVSVYMRGDNNRIENCTFANEATFGNVQGSTHYAGEMHGNKQIFANNIVNNYMGGLIIAPYTTEGTTASDYVVTGNIMHVSFCGVTIWRNYIATLGELHDILISNNQIDISDEGSGWTEVPSTGIKMSPWYNISNITIVNNKITKREGFVNYAVGIWMTCVEEGESISNVFIGGNDISGVTHGIYIYQLAGQGTVKRIAIVNNNIHGFSGCTEPEGITPVYGILATSANVVTETITITGNTIDNTELDIVDDVGIGTSDTLTGMVAGENIFAGLTTDQTGYHYDSGAEETIKWNISREHLLLLTDNCTLTFIAPPRLSTLTLIVLQDEVGSRTITWPGTVLWPGTDAPTLSTTVNQYDVITFIYDGTYYHGISVAKYDAVDSYYYGRPSADGSWRTIKDSNEIDIDRRETGSWVTKATVAASSISLMNTYPLADNTYYLGKNDDDTPLAWKGVTLKDQGGTGKYYRLEIFNDAVRIVDLTD